MGVLIGRASLDVDNFLKMVNYAEREEMSLARAAGKQKSDNK